MVGLGQAVCPRLKRQEIENQSSWAVSASDIVFYKAQMNKESEGGHFRVVWRIAENSYIPLRLVSIKAGYDPSPSPGLECEVLGHIVTSSSATRLPNTASATMLKLKTTELFLGLTSLFSLTGAVAVRAAAGMMKGDASFTGSSIGGGTCSFANYTFPAGVSGTGIGPSNWATGGNADRAWRSLGLGVASKSWCV